jgi:hypothetical protein
MKWKTTRERKPGDFDQDLDTVVMRSIDRITNSTTDSALPCTAPVILSTLISAVRIMLLAIRPVLVYQLHLHDEEPP